MVVYKSQHRAGFVRLSGLILSRGTAAEWCENEQGDLVTVGSPSPVVGRADWKKYFSVDIVDILGVKISFSVRGAYLMSKRPKPERVENVEKKWIPLEKSVPVVSDTIKPRRVPNKKKQPPPSDELNE